MNWKLSPGLWECGPYSITLQFCERRKLEQYELYDHTRFVDVFPNVASAKLRAEQMGVPEFTLEVQ